MSNFWHIFFIWVHILGIALYVGPQFFLAFAWVPASRGIADLPTRVQAMRTITRRFGYIGGAGLVLIILAGGYLIGNWRDFYSVPDDVGFTDLRFGVVFIVKMTLLLIMLVAVGIHMFVVGPRLLRTMEVQAAGQPVTEEQLRSLRMQSMFLSIAALAIVLVIMVLGVMLNTTSWSLQES